MKRQMIAALALLAGLQAGACAGGGTATPTTLPVTETNSPEGGAPVGTLRTVAGAGNELGDGGPARSAGLCGPNDVALDGAGNIYISDAGLFCKGPGGNTVRKVDPNGVITTVAGTGEKGFSGDGGPASSALLNAPMAVAVDREGNLYIADLYNYRIRKVDPKGTITTIAGTGEAGFSGDEDPATAARLFAWAEGEGFTGGMTFDAEGNLFVADGGKVRKIDPSGTITTVAGIGSGGFSGDGGPATEALVSAVDVAVDLDGNLYISGGLDNHRIRRVDRDGVITTVAGTGRKAIPDDGGPATSTPLWDPWGIAVDADGNLFIAEHHANIIHKVDPNGIITTVAGIFQPSTMGRGLFNGEEGPATEMHLNEPVGLFVDGEGVLYIADTFNARIRAIYFEDAP